MKMRKTGFMPRQNLNGAIPEAITMDLIFKDWRFPCQTPGRHLPFPSLPFFFSSAPRSRPPNRLPPPLAGSPCCSRHIKKDQAASPATVLPRPTASSNEAQFGRTDSGWGREEGEGGREILKVYRPWKKGTRKHEQPSARLTWRLFRRGKGAGGGG